MPRPSNLPERVTDRKSGRTQGAQEISREWFARVQERMRRTMDGLNALTRCRSVRDVVAV